MNLIVDAGNTYIKLAVFNGHSLLWQQKFETRGLSKDGEKGI